MATTQKDIAKLLDVSVNTVSRALKDMPDIGLATRKRVKEAAAVLGYRPNLNARSLVLKKSFTIGLAVSESDNPVRMEFCEKLRLLATADKYCVISAGLGIPDKVKTVTVVEELLAHGIDALVIGYLEGILAEQPIGRLLQECREADIPVVVFGNVETGLADNIRVDLAESAERISIHLLDRKRIPVIFSKNQSTDSRYLGYCSAMEKRGQKDKIICWPISDHRLVAGKEALESYLEKFGTPPSAIIAPNDLAAIGIISAIRKHGYQIPQDCAVVGFDNTEFGAYIDPPLTSIGFCNDLFTQTVWTLLKERLNGSVATAARQITLKQDLIVRRSS